MGEAKRRKEALGRKLAYRDTATGEPLAVRSAGDPLAFRESIVRLAQSYLAGGSVESKVPCNGCRECCWHAGVDVRPEEENPENLKRLDLEQRDDGGWYLRKRQDGACVHLGPAGCTVYQHRPNACRSYDCRLYALTGVMDRYDGTHKQPPWQFQPENVEARVFLATCQMMGLFEFKQQQRDGKPCSAHDIARAVLVDVDKFEMFSKGLLQLATASPDEQRRMLGIDPGTISTDQMVAAMRKIVGDDGIVMVRDQGGSET